MNLGSVLLYATAWVDRDGALQLRWYTYGLDVPVARALRKRVPRESHDEVSGTKSLNY